MDTIPKFILPYNQDIFQLVREIPLVEIIERYSPNPIIYKYGKPRVLCPFHGDKNPSLSLKGQRYRCFGCNESGDGIDFVAKLFNLSPIEAARMIAKDFGIMNDVSQTLTEKQRQEIRARQELRKLEKLWKQATNLNLRLAYSLRDGLKKNVNMEDVDPELIETLAQLENYIEVLTLGNRNDILNVIEGGWFYDSAFNG